MNGRTFHLFVLERPQILGKTAGLGLPVQPSRKQVAWTELLADLEASVTPY